MRSISTMTKDTRPEISPYAFPSIALNFQGGSTLYISAHLLTQSHKLGSMVLQQNTLQFTDVSADSGHVLVHYLFTGTYQCLRPKKLSVQDGVAAEFLTSVRVYNVAQTYTLQPLVELAKDEIQKLGKNLRTTLIFDLVKDAYPSPRTDDIWLSTYLKAQLRLFLESPLKSLAEKKVEDQAAMSISDLLFKSMSEIYHEHTVSLHEGQSQAMGQASTNTAKESEEQASEDAEEQAAREADAIAEEEREIARLLNKKNNSFMGLSSKLEQRLSQLQAKAMERVKEQAACKAECLAREAEGQAAREARKEAATSAHPESTHRLHKESVETEALREDKMIQKYSAPGGVELFDPLVIGKADTTKDDAIHLEAKAAQDNGINTSQNNVTNTEALGVTKEKEKKKEKNKKKKNNNKSVAAINPTPGVSEGCLLEKSNQNTKDGSNVWLDPWIVTDPKKGKAKNKKSDVKTSVSGSPSVDLTDAHNHEARADENKTTRADDEMWSFWGFERKPKKNDTAMVDRESVLPLPLPPCDPKALGIQIDSGLA
ncbi:hypothetical protein GGI43DRAFT_362518 [Trichoderma evansii]